MSYHDYYVNTVNRESRLEDFQRTMRRRRGSRARAAAARRAESESTWR